jgi:hypothetical protein
VDIETSGEPYGQAWDVYRRAGWAGVLPLPPGHKGPPPRGFTGWAGVDPSRADIQAWLDDSRLGPASNIGLHLPSGVYGLDVDNYDAKTGGVALFRLVEQLGPLPSTWVTGSRDDGVSGIRLYRAALPPGRVWIDEPGGHQAGIEAIHKGHRYAVVWPSVHPDTGRVYTWRHETGHSLGTRAPEVPGVEGLPELPAAWIEALSRPGEVRMGTQAGHDETVATVTSWREGEPCERVARAAERAMGGLAAAAAGAALHPASEAGTWELACLGHEGHAGVRRALAEHYAGHLDARVARDGEASRREADGEWWRLVRGAIGKLVGPPVEVCDCDAWAGVGVTFMPEDLGAPSSRISDPTDGEFSSSAPAAAGLDGPRDLTSWTLSPAELMARPRPEPLVSGLLYRDTLAWLIGKSGSFKSFVALDLAAAVAAESGNSKWLGRAVYGGPVLYVVAEGVGGMGLRLQAWTERHGPMSERLRLLPRAVQAKGEHWSTLVELARQLGPALIVLDTQARVSVGVNENSNTEIGELIARLDELRAATGACVLVVHHIGRSGEDARGASALDGAQDTELKVERIGGPKALRVKLTVDKQKDAPDTDEMMLDLERVELGRDETTGEELSSLVVLPDLVLDPFPTESWRLVKNENQALILNILAGQFSERGGTRAEVAAVLREQGQRGDLKYRQSTFYDAWNAILKKDLIEQVRGTQRFILTDVALSRTLTCVSAETRN